MINPTVVDARTDVTTKLLADEGYAVISQGDEADEEQEETYFARDFEKKFFSEETNKMFVKIFMDNALRDPITGEIGKGIIFCACSKNHTAAERVCRYDVPRQILFGFCYADYIRRYERTDIYNQLPEQ